MAGLLRWSTGGPRATPLRPTPPAPSSRGLMNLFLSLTGRRICIDMGTIYSIKNKLNGKEYIGQTRYPVEKRWGEHVCVKRRITTIGHAIRKHGVENFEFSVLETCNDEVLNDREIFWITERKTVAPQGYNQTSGGSSFIPSEETRKRISEGTKLGHSKMSDESRERQREGGARAGRKNKGRRHDDDTIARIRGAWTPQKRKAMGESKRGKSLNISDENRLARNSKKSGFGNGKVTFDESHVQRIIESYDPEKPKMAEYERIAKELGLSAVTVRRVLKGRHWAVTLPDPSSQGASS